MRLLGIWTDKLTFGGPSNDIYGLVVLGEGCEVVDFTLEAVTINLPEADIVVTTGGSQTPLAAGLEVSRVDWGVLVVPIDD